MASRCMWPLIRVSSSWNQGVGRLHSHLGDAPGKSYSNTPGATGRTFVLVSLGLRLLLSYCCDWGLLSEANEHSHILALLGPLASPIYVTSERNRSIYKFTWLSQAHLDTQASQVALVVKIPPANAEAWDAGSIPGSGRSPGGGHGNPSQCFCLENLIDSGAWWAIVHRVVKSWTQVQWLSMHACT